MKVGIFTFLCMLFLTIPLYAELPDNPFSALYQRTLNFSVIELYDNISQLEQKYQAAKAREQSIANRLIGAAAIGAGGIGGMRLVSGLAEQAADDAAERDMRAYLETFRCDYGAGKNIHGGETNIELPGGNELLPMVAEYKALAADLKQRKDILELAPGIESELVLDAAETGLYDNVALGKTGGVYTSVARALTDESGEDAAQWDAQKSAAQNKTKTGAIIGGAGVGIGIVGNIAESVIYNKKK